jgi:hypothetical protein
MLRLLRGIMTSIYVTFVAFMFCVISAPGTDKTRDYLSY